MATRLSALYKMSDILQYPWRLISPESGSSVTISAVSKAISNKRLIYVGETHEESEVIKLEFSILNLLVDQIKETNSGVVKVFMEHFNISQQNILDDFMRGEICQNTLVQKYNEGEEGHDIEKYSSLLQFAQENADKVKLIGGFLPRSFARVLVKEGETVAYNRAIESGYLTEEDRRDGSDLHYNFFHSLISGRSLESEFDGVTDNFRRIFPAQIIKDNTMASIIRRTIKSSSPSDKFLVIAGSGHLDYRFGVPERVDHFNMIPVQETCLLTVRQAADPGLKDGSPCFRVSQFPVEYPADYILLYTPDDENEELIKQEIAEAYEKVASTADIQGNIRLAHKVMTRLGYSGRQLEIAGEEAANYQGVGCPHALASICTGEHVLDLGSGLGVDSFIAAEATGEEGSVTGIDISRGEVLHATARAEARNAANVRFVVADMENLPMEDDQFHVVISNGAFCLAPNKEKAFREIYRILKPGGRFSVACTTLLTQLDTQVSWPLCMRVFMPLDQARPMLESIGFQNVVIDDSDTKMNLDIEEEPSSQQNGESSSRRTGVHVGSEEFRHLEGYNMDTMCARVVLVGTKP